MNPQAPSSPDQKPKKKGFFRRPQEIDLPPEVASGRQPYFCGRAPFIALLILALIGIFATGFLTHRHIVLESDTGVVGGSALCRAEGKINCDAILLTNYAVLFGYVSSAALGLSGFVFVLWITVNALINQGLRKIATAVLVLYFFAAIGFSWYFVYLMIYKVPFICTWCIVTHCVNLCCLIIIVSLAIRRKRELLLREISSIAERTYFVAGGILASLLVLVAAGFWEKSLSFTEAKIKYEELANDPVVVMAMLRSSPTHKIPIFREDPIYGSPKARFHIILFSDFQCPICSKAESFLKRLVKANQDKLNLVYKNYPLSDKCNPGILDKGQYHPQACMAARAAAAAYALGGARAFWAYGDLLFQNQKRLDDSKYTQFARQLKLNEPRFREMMKPGSKADKKVKKDIQLGLKLGLNATPQLFFQGKKLPENFQGGYLIGTLEQLVRMNHPKLKTFRLKLPVR